MKTALALALILAAASSWAAEECKDTGKVYKVCANQEDSYKSSLEKAKAEGKALVVVLGAEWCPWCVSLHSMLSDPKFGGEFGKKFVLSDVAIFKEKQKLESGVKVLTQLKDLAHYQKKIEGVPIMAMVNPKTQKAVFIDTEPLEKNTKTTQGHDAKKVLAALEKGAAEIK